MTCSHETCDRRAESRGLCSMHYDRLRRSSEFTPRKYDRSGRLCSRCSTRKVKAREMCEPCYRRALRAAEFGSWRTQATILARVVERDNGCWNWTAVVVNGYGRLENYVAHRVSYEVFVGPIPPGLELDHLCRNTRCVNPAHLEPVTHDENMRRRSAAQTHCKRGHEFTAANTYRTREGRRCCRLCQQEAQRRYKDRKSSEAAA